MINGNNKMKVLKFLMFILPAIIIFSCYSNDPDCGYSVGKDPIFWERTIFWNTTPERLTSISGIAVANNGDLWATTSDGIFLSTNNGDTWIPKSRSFFSTSSLTAIAISPINGYIFVTSPTHRGMFRSTDNGENWVLVTYNMDIRDIIITPSGEIYIGVEYYNPTTTTIYYSNDNGDTWVEKNNRLPFYAGESSPFVFIIGSILSLALGKDGTLYAWFFDKGLYCSNDGGDNWLPLPFSNYNNAAVELTVSYDGSILMTTNGYGVLKSTDRGVTWIQANTGLYDFSLVSIIYNPISKDIFVSNNSFNDPRIYRSTNLGASWKLENTDIQMVTGIRGAFAVNPNTGQLYVAGRYGLYRLRNYP